MASTMIEPASMDKYEVSLNQSIQELLDQQSKSNIVHKDFVSNFYELMQIRANPPVETIWVYSALKFRSSNPPKDELLGRLEAIKNLFGLISACSVSCSSSESIILMAPVLYELHNLVVDMKSQSISSKTEKKVMQGINSLSASILAFINICCSGDHAEKCLIRPLEDLVRVWIGGDEIGGSKLFFPLLSDGIIQWLSEEDNNGADELAGAVIMEAFLFRFCLDINRGTSKQELQKDLITWSISSITGFHHVYFFEILVRTLLDQTLPVTSLLKSEDEGFLRKIVCDAVILSAYSLCSKNAALARLIVTHEAVEIYRRSDDQAKAISYINAFSTSNIPSQLIKLVKNEIGLISKVAKPSGSSPKAFLQWLLKLQDQGFSLFEDGTIESRARLAMEKSKSEDELVKSDRDAKFEDDDLFYVDKEGEDKVDEDEEGEDVNAKFMAAAQKMKLGENESGRKRKQEKKKRKEKPIKFTKYNLRGNSEASEKMDSDSEIENPVSNEEDSDED
ncbi:uncharacterized protein LOC124942503 [Impatiens glandulifera]|uniref:uncharacterized protein LOC124942503 n=1 Tax=Impatiens glandulifera TaxID=253017 RepID=UPI001FB13105|nr:uncharacterized protein LOC124942503 [Impatiens glandulifera]